MPHRFLVFALFLITGPGAALADGSEQAKTSPPPQHPQQLNLFVPVERLAPLPSPSRSHTTCSGQMLPPGRKLAELYSQYLRLHEYFTAIQAGAASAAPLSDQEQAQERMNRVYETWKSWEAAYKTAEQRLHFSIPGLYFLFGFTYAELIELKNEVTHIGASTRFRGKIPLDLRDFLASTFDAEPKHIRREYIARVLNAVWKIMSTSDADQLKFTQQLSRADSKLVFNRNDSLEDIQAVKDVVAALSDPWLAEWVGFHWGPMGPNPVESAAFARRINDLWASLSLEDPNLLDQVFTDCESLAIHLAKRIAHKSTQPHDESQPARSQVRQLTKAVQTLPQSKIAFETLLQEVRERLFPSVTSQ